jgi:hypothetical protein
MNNTTIICIPNALINKCRVCGVVISGARSTLGRLGLHHTLNYSQQWFWCPILASDTAIFCKPYQMMKSSNNKPTGLFHSLLILSRPWESMSIDFMGLLPISKGKTCDGCYMLSDINGTSSCLQQYHQNY